MDKLKEKRKYINIRKYTVLCDLTKIVSFLLFSFRNISLAFERDIG